MFNKLLNPKYVLVVGAIPGQYHIGWIAGSVIAHIISSRISGKIFWFCPYRKRGIAEDDKKYFDLETFNALQNNILSEYGYFYDGDENKISWQFKIENIFPGDFFLSHPDKLKEFEKFFSFRRKYLEDYSKVALKGDIWILISNIKRLVNPISPKNIKGKKLFESFKVLTYDEKKSLSTTDFRHNTVFTIQSRSSPNTIDFDASDLIDTYLKQFFMRKMPEETLREKVIQQAYVFSIANKYGWRIATEEVLSDKNRIDVLFEEENGYLTAVEIKRDDDDTSVDQLKGYIAKLKERKEYRMKPIFGKVICSRATDVLISKAKDEDFKVIEYKLSINFRNV